MSNQQSARYEKHATGQEMNYQGYMDHSVQSPSMQALANFVGEAPPPEDPGCTGQPGEHGYSDF